MITKIARSCSSVSGLFCDRSYARAFGSRRSERKGEREKEKTKEISRRSTNSTLSLFLSFLFSFLRILLLFLAFEIRNDLGGLERERVGNDDKLEAEEEESLRAR